MKFRPYLMIQKRKDRSYLACVVKDDLGRNKTIRSFGSASKAENWDKAIEFVLDEQRSWYNTLKAQHLHV